MFTTEDCASLQFLHESVQCNEMLIDSIQFTSENVFEELSNLQHDKPCGPDNLLVQLLTVIAEFMSLPISHLFQWSPSSGTLPRDWVTANIVPARKKGDIYLPSNYHPISLTSIVVIIMERIIRQLVGALESKHLINDSQHGFHHKHSTVTLLLQQLMTVNFSLKDGAQFTVYC